MKIISMVCFFVLLFCCYCDAAEFYHGSIDSMGRKSSEKLKLGGFSFSAEAGLSLPSGDIANVLSTGIELGGAFSWNDFIIKDFSLVVTGSYCAYTGQVNSSDIFSTIKTALLGRYYIFTDQIPGVIFVEAGGGISLENLTIASTNLNNIDPLYVVGLGYETGVAQDLSFIGEINYEILPQKYISGATRDGAFLNFNLGFKYEFGTDNGGRIKK